MGATNCPETPRQKMITMMYLVYTAMLALNVSAEVIQGFKSVGTALHESNKNLEFKLHDSYDNFRIADSLNNGKYDSLYTIALEVRELSNGIKNYIDSIYKFFGELFDLLSLVIFVLNFGRVVL